MSNKWISPETAPQDGTLFIYTSKIKPESNKKAGVVSQAFWRDADEDQNEGFWDADIGEEPSIAGWLPRPTEIE